MIDCKLCGKECKNFNALAKHFFFSHKEQDKQEYYDTYVGARTNCVCCQSPTKFLGLGLGYQQTCSPKCRASLGWSNDDGSRKLAVSDRLTANNIGIPGARKGRPNKNPYPYTEKVHLRMKRLNSGEAKRDTDSIWITPHEYDSISKVFGV